MVKVSYREIKESYDEVKRAACGRQACTVMIMVAYEVDAMASARMLTQILRNDNVAYTLRPVLNFADVQHSYSLKTDDITTIFMINCGAIYNIPKMFDLERGGDLRVFILDNHRPFHLANYYSRHNVVVFDDEDEESGLETYYPSDGAMLSSDMGNNSSETSSSDDDDDEQDGEFDEEFDEEDELSSEGGRSQLSQEAEAELSENDHDDEGEDDDNDDDDGKEGEHDTEDGEDVLGDDEGDNNGDSDDGDDDDDDDEEYVTRRGSGKDNKKRSKYGSGEGSDSPSQQVGSNSALKRKRVMGDSSPVGLDTTTEDADLTMVEGWGGVTTSRPSDAFNGDEEEDAEDEEEQQVRVVGRRRRTAAQIARREEKRRKMELRIYYTKNVTYAAPTACMLLYLVLGMSAHIPLDIMWQAILGVTDQHIRGNLDEEAYAMCCADMKIQLSNHLLSAAGRVKYTVSGEVAAVAGGAAVTTEGGGAVATADAGRQHQDIVVPGAETGHIEEGAEYRFFLHRHWPLYDAMFHSPYIASKLSVWHPQGTARLQEMLAKMGIPLQQCKQSFQFMEPSLKTHFRHEISSGTIADLYGLTDPDVVYRSFYRFNSFKNPIAAADVVLAATALLEMYGVEQHVLGAVSSASAGGESASASSSVSSVVAPSAVLNKISSIDAFNDSYDCLSMRSDDLLRKGIQSALDLQRTLVKKVSVLLDGRDSILRFNRLYYTYLRVVSPTGGGGGGGGPITVATSSTPGGAAPSGGGGGSSGSEHVNAVEHSFGRPMVLQRLGQFIMDIKRNLAKKDGGWTGSALLPLILLAEKSGGESFLVVGISPLQSAAASGGVAITEEQHRRLLPLTNFRQFFKQAAKEIHASYRSNSFDTNVIEIDKNDVQDFLGTLDFLLKQATRSSSATAVH